MRTIRPPVVERKAVSFKRISLHFFKLYYPPGTRCPFTKLETEVKGRIVDGEETEWKLAVGSAFVKAIETRPSGRVVVTMKHEW